MTHTIWHWVSIPSLSGQSVRHDMTTKVPSYVVQGFNPLAVGAVRSACCGVHAKRPAPSGFNPLTVGAVRSAASVRT